MKLPFNTQCLLRLLSPFCICVFVFR
jgi:hypothetical protein